MSPAVCYACGSTDSVFFSSENGYALVKCRQCGLIFVSNPPAPDQISEAARQGLHGGLTSRDVTGHFRPRAVARYLDVLKQLGPIDDVSTWLDVGCGHGEFLVALQQFYGGRVAARGTEPNIRKQESARARGLDVGFFDLDSHPERYDALSLLNVYSHLPDPPSFLSSLAKILNPRGWLLLQTGDSAHLSPREHYRPFGLPDHLSFASEAIIRGLLDRFGFQVTGVIKYQRDTLGSAKVWKEVVKLAIPGYRSKVPDAIRYRGPKYLTDMYVLARRAG